MLNIKDLFKKYDAHFKGSEKDFTESGMINISQKLDYGFFPLGSGILNEKSKTEVAEVEENGILVLGNDFGTTKYLESISATKRESPTGNPTLRNLIVKLKLPAESTFYTNFFMGLRDNSINQKTTNIDSEEPKLEPYRKLCADFFLTQLNHTRAKKVLVLGPKVAHALYLSFNGQFAAFKSKSAKISDYYKNGNQGCFINPTEGPLKGYEFMVIPHPSFSHISWNGLGIEERVGDWNK